MLDPSAIKAAHERIEPYIHHTPILRCNALNTQLSHEFFFKAEMFQKTGAFKARGAFNALLSLKEQNALPSEVIAFSSGNHGQALALAGSKLGVKPTIFMTKKASTIKRQATEHYGGNVILTDTRAEAEERIAALEAKGAYVIHPFDNDMIIAGQGTACYEALQEVPNIDAIFATCGGGGLLSGSFLAKELLSPHSKIYAGEPLQANDAARSYRSGTITCYTQAPETIADGAMSLSVSPRSFEYIQQIDGFYEPNEADIIHWCRWLTHFLKATVEPTAAVAFAAAATWLKTQATPQRIMVILSGGNVAPASWRRIWGE